MSKRQLNLNARTTIIKKKLKKLINNLLQRSTNFWLNILFPLSDYLKPGNPFKNLNRGRVSNIIGKTVPIFRPPETEGPHCAAEVRH